MFNNDDGGGNTDNDKDDDVNEMERTQLSRQMTY